MEETTIKGRVISASSNKYTVDLGAERVIINARGKIKYRSGEILTGDFVEVTNDVISHIYPRTSRFIRPNIANIDTLCVVISNPPKPDYLVVDKLLLSANFANVECAIIINKTDLDTSIFDYVKKNYNFLRIFNISAKTKSGIEELREFLNHKTVAFAGQSAVGKTSILNALMNTEYKTGEISEKSERGKHTTTGSQIIDCNGFLLFDTPGFSEISVEISPQDAVTNYPPYDKILNECRYPDCMHVSEPNCKIKQLIEEGKLSSDRHARYIEILQEIKKDYETRYGNKKY